MHVQAVHLKERHDHGHEDEKHPRAVHEVELGNIRTEPLLNQGLAVVGHCRKREIENSSTGDEDRPEVTISAMIFAVTGANRMPLRKCPVATRRLSMGVVPSIGILSGVSGRSPAQV